MTFFTELTTPSLSPLICLISVIFLSAVAVWVFTEIDKAEIKILKQEIEMMKEEYAE